MRMTVETFGPAIDLERFIAAIPLLVERSRGIRFTDDGCAVLDGNRAPKLRRVEPPGTYAVDYDERSRPATVTIVRDDADVIEVLTAAPSDSEVRDASGVITLDKPDVPEQLRVAGGLSITDMPKVVGQSWDFAGQVRLLNFHAGDEPQIAMQLTSRIGEARSTARIERRAAAVAIGPDGDAIGPDGDVNRGGETDEDLLGVYGEPMVDEPMVDDGDVWEVHLEIEMRPRGLGRLAGLALPFVRRRMAQVIGQQITEVLIETAEQIEQDFDPDDGPQQIADKAWAEIVAELT